MDSLHLLPVHRIYPLRIYPHSDTYSLYQATASDVDNFTIYALKDEIIDGEEEISDELADKKKQDIHAKIYLRRKYSDVDLYLGSMNASYSAINKIIYI